MADKSVPQLTAKTSSVSGDLFHLVRDNVDYKIDFDDLQTSIIGGTAGEIIYKASLTIATADVLTLFATPLLIVAAPAAGYHIEVVNATAKITYNSIAYATNTTLTLIIDTATVACVNFGTAWLSATATKISNGLSATSTGVSDTQLIAAKGLYVKVATGNPTAGNSEVRVYVSYRIVQD